MIDKSTVCQIIGCLMKKPQYLSEIDKYLLTVADFSSFFEKYVFSAIFNLYKDGASVISVVDIDNYFDTHELAKNTFNKENGIDFLQDCLDLSQPDNFPFYYKRLKKFNALKDLKASGFDTSELYCDNLLDEKATEVNEKFETLDVTDIFDMVKKKLIAVESPYKTGDASETADANQNIRELLKDLESKPDIGVRLQGDIFNTVCKGGRKTKFFVRSAASGTGKTRAAIGDACYVAYPIRFNPERWQWEMTGSCEKTLFIATEQELNEVQTIILAYLTGFNEDKILFSQYSSLEKEVVNQALDIMDYFSDNLKIVRLPNPCIEQVKAIIRQNWMLYNIENVFFDYIFSSPALLNEFRDLRIREDK